MKGYLLKWTQKPETVKSSECIDAEGTLHEQEFESHCSNDSEQPRDRDNQQTDIEEQYDAAISTPLEEEFETSAASTTSNMSIFNDDVSSWQIPVPDSVSCNVIQRGSEPFQNKQGPVKSVKRPGAKIKGVSRQLSTAWFYHSLSNGDRVLRSRMAYSLSDGKLYCFCCRLFAKYDKAPETSAFVTGFEAWWKLNTKIVEHEQSKDHLSCLENWKTLASGLQLQKTIDAATISLIEKKKRKLRDILHRVLDVILFLARQNLSFRGHREDASSLNKGNFLELVELLSHYDVALREHLVRPQERTDSQVLCSYMSPETQNEFISLLAKHVTGKLVSDINNAKYFRILFDSTPDISHTDQMSTVIRYLHISGGTVEVRESFL